MIQAILLNPSACLQQSKDWWSVKSASARIEGWPEFAAATLWPYHVVSQAWEMLQRLCLIFTGRLCEGCLLIELLWYRCQECKLLFSVRTVPYKRWESSLLKPNHGFVEEATIRAESRKQLVLKSLTQIRLLAYFSYVLKTVCPLNLQEGKWGWAASKCKETGERLISRRKENNWFVCISGTNPLFQASYKKLINKWFKMKIFKSDHY